MDLLPFEDWVPDLGLAAPSWPAQLQGCEADKMLRLLSVFLCFLPLSFALSVLFIFLLVFREFSIYLEKVSFVQNKRHKSLLCEGCWDPRTQWGKQREPVLKEKVLYSVMFVSVYCWLNSLSTSVTSSLNKCG